MFHCYLDDFAEGSIFETEGKTLSEAEIMTRPMTIYLGLKRLSLKILG